MGKYTLKNSKGEYLKTLDTANGVLEFTTNVKEAVNYNGRPGGGRWDAENEFQFINYHFKDEYGDRVTTLEVVFEEYEDE